MHHAGIGGGGFLTVRSGNGSIDYMDFRDAAPSAASQDMFKGNVNASRIGGLARFVAHRTHIMLSQYIEV